MGSLTDLNSYANETLDITDQRAPGPLFSIPAPSDQELTAESTQIDIITGLFDLVDIVRPDVAQLQLELDLSAVQGVTVNWDNVFSGDSVTNINGVFTYSNIDTVEEWNSIKNSVIVLPEDFQGSFFYTVKFIWQGAEQELSVEWQVGTYVPVANLKGSFTSSILVNRIIPIEPISLESSFEVSGLNLKLVTSEGDLNSEFNFNANVNRIANGRFNKGAQFNISITPTEIEPLNDYNITRTYDANARNKIFSTNPITNNYDQFESFKIVIDVSDGLLYHSENELANKYGTSIQLTNNDLSLLVFKLETVEFYPDLDQTSNLTYTVSLYINNQLAGGTGTAAPLNYSGATQAIKSGFSLFSTTEFPVHPYAIQYLNVADITVLGGGGGGDIFTGGAAGGATIFVDNSWTLEKMQSATINSVGAGGQWTGISGTNTDGGSTQVVYNGITRNAPGGERGRDSLGRGGNTIANGVTRTGGIIVSSAANEAAGGGGAGISNDGEDAYVSGTFVFWGYGGAGTIVRNFFDFEDGLVSYLTGLAAIGGGGYSSNVTQEQKQVTRSETLKLIGNGGWAGPTNPDGKGHGSQGGVIVNYRS